MMCCKVDFERAPVSKGCETKAVWLAWLPAKGIHDGTISAQAIKGRVCHRR